MSGLTPFLERLNRPGLLGLAGKALARRCTKELTSYFRKLSAEVRKLKLENLAGTGSVSEEITRHAVEMRLHNLMRVQRPLLLQVLTSNLTDAYKLALKLEQPEEAVSILAGVREALGDEGPTAEGAVEWASDNAAEAITGIDETTAELIADAVMNGIERQLGVPGTANLIEDVLDGISTYRAEMIATTEMNAAMSAATLAKLYAGARDYKQWILGPDPCEVCIDNADASPIPIDEDFPSGDDSPPAHPNCRCAVAGARAPE